MATFDISSMENITGQLASIPPDFEVVVRHDGPLWPELEIASGRWALKGWTSDTKNGTYRYDGKAVSFKPADEVRWDVPVPEVTLTAAGHLPFPGAEVLTDRRDTAAVLARLGGGGSLVVDIDYGLWPVLGVLRGKWDVHAWTCLCRNGRYVLERGELKFYPAPEAADLSPGGDAAWYHDPAPAQGLARAAGSLAHPASRHEAAALARPAVEGYPETARDVGGPSLRETLPVKVPVEGFRALAVRAPFRFATVFYVDDRDLANAVDKRVETLLLERVGREVDRRAREVVGPDSFRAAQEVADAVRADREAAAAFLLAASRSGATACRAPRMVLADAADAILHGMHAGGEGSDR